jgi:hypothetical protein
MRRWGDGEMRSGGDGEMRSPLVMKLQLRNPLAGSSSFPIQKLLLFKFLY